MSATAAPPGGMSFDFTPEQRMLRKTVHDFVERKVPKAYSRELEEYPAELAKRIAAAGLNGIGIPEELGGEGGDIVDQVIVMEELARSLAGLGWLWGLNVWSGGKAVVTHGSPEQQAEMLPLLAAGKLQFAFAMTEPDGGTDVLRAMKTRATRTDGGWLLNGTKIWSTLSHVADRVIVLARTSDHDKPSRGLTMFIVRKGAEGFDAKPIPKLGMRALGSCQVSIRDVFVGDGDVLGEVDQGWKYVMASLNSERIMVAAMCTGIQILGGNGYAMEYDMQRYWRDVRLLQIGPITSEMARNYIGESLGLPRSF